MVRHRLTVRGKARLVPSFLYFMKVEESVTGLFRAMPHDECREGMGSTVTHYAALPYVYQGIMKYHI